MTVVRLSLLLVGGETGANFVSQSNMAAALQNQSIRKLVTQLNWKLLCDLHSTANHESIPQISSVFLS